MKKINLGESSFESVHKELKLSFVKPKNESRYFESYCLNLKSNLTRLVHSNLIPEVNDYLIIGDPFNDGKKIKFKVLSVDSYYDIGSLIERKATFEINLEMV